MRGQFLPYKDENVTKSFPYITYGLILINIAVFIWSLTNFENIIFSYGFVPAQFVLITLLSSMFLHGGLDHIFGNMLYLYLFGDNVEDTFGRIKFLIFYLLSGLAASLAHFATNIGSVIPAIGASGAISGVLGAYLILFPKVKVHVASYYYAGKISAYYLIGFWFVMQLLLGTVSLFGARGSGIAFFAHIGGFIFGAIVTYIYKKLRK